jgi:hypothetical protein
MEGKRGSYKELLEQNRALRRENRQLRERVGELELKVLDLQDKLDAALGRGLRQAAPFRVADKRKKDNPGKPGRKRGHKGVWRGKPQHVDERVEVPLDRCPKCGGSVHSVKPVEQYIEDIPQVRPHVTHLITYTGRCPRCGRVRTAHPLQSSTATGAAGVHLGPRALGLAADLSKRLGFTTRKTCEILRAHFGLRVSAGGLVQALRRVSARLEDIYEKLQADIRASPAVYADETSWWVGGAGWWLWVFTTPKRTVYVVEHSRGQQVVEAALGESFGGTLVSDCLASYDPIQCKKHKCYGHHLKAIAQAREHAPESRFLHDIRLMLKVAAAVGEDPQLTPEYKRQVAPRFERWADALLDAVHTDPWEQRIAKRLRKQRQHLFTFLYDERVEPTNNRAERELRPAVIARKLSCGNKTERGKHTWEILASVASTCHHNGIPFAQFVSQAMPLRAAPPHLLPATR